VVHQQTFRSGYSEPSSSSARQNRSHMVPVVGTNAVHFLSDEIAASQFSVNRKIEQGQFPGLFRRWQAKSFRPEVFHLCKDDGGRRGIQLGGAPGRSDITQGRPPCHQARRGPEIWIESDGIDCPSSAKCGSHDLPWDKVTSMVKGRRFPVRIPKRELGYQGKIGAGSWSFQGWVPKRELGNQCKSRPFGPSTKGKRTKSKGLR